MRVPQKPPEPNFMPETLRGNVSRFMDLWKKSKSYLLKGRYAHWDKVRHLKPPDGFTLQEWWFAIKMDRTGSRKGIPLADVSGMPFGFGMPDPFVEHLHHIDQDLGGRLEMSEEALANSSTRDRYLVRSLVEEAITSSQLEGSVTTRVIAKEMIRTGRKPINRSEQMILNNYVAMRRIQKLKDQPLNMETLLELHRILTQDAIDDPSAAGRLRNVDEQVTVYDDVDDQVLHNPPPADELSRRLGAFFDFANGTTPDFFLHPIIRAIITHFWLAYEHPFVDGNGRCARALFYWSMLRQGAWLCEFLSISQVIRKAPIKYGRAFLYTETDDNDLTYFILYHLQIIRQAIDLLHEYINQKSQAMQQTRNLLRKSTALNHRQMALLEHALRHPDAEYTIRSHQTSHNVSNQTARTDLYHLKVKGLLEERHTGKAYYYYPAKDLEARLKRLS